MIVTEAARKMCDGGFGMMPVGENDRMIGTISDRDIAMRAATLRARQGDYPDPWDDSVFDLILQLDYSEDTPPALTRVIEPF